MALGRQMNDAIDLLILHQLIECLEVADVHPYEPIVRLILDILQVSQVASIGQLIQIEDVILRIFIDEQAYNMTANEACSTSDYYISF